MRAAWRALTGDYIMDQLSQIIAYEQGELDQDATVALFQALVDSGLAWRLQGHYGRTAVALIEAGLVTRASPVERIQRANDGEGIEPHRAGRAS